MKSPFSASVFFRDPETYARQLAQDEPIRWLRAGRMRFAVVRDPDAIWNVLVSDADSFRGGQWKQRSRRVVGDALNTLDGEAHRERRRLIGPSFDGGRVTERGASIVERAERMQARWSDGGAIVAREHVQRLSLCAAGDLLFSSDLEAQAHELAPALARVAADLTRRMPPSLVPGRRQALRRARDAVREMVAERLRAPDGHEDTLSALLGSGMPLPTVRGEVLAMLNAAVDEPPSGLESAWFLLAQAPEAERRLHDEVVSSSSLEDRLPYLQAVVKETLRLMPPVRHIHRSPVGSALLLGQRVDASENVVVSPVVTHRDPALHPSPEAFMPERWLTPEGTGGSIRGTYLPFGAGPHACIGAALGRTVISLTLAAVAREWRLRLVDHAADPRRAAVRFRLERW